MQTLIVTRGAKQLILTERTFSLTHYPGTRLFWCTRHSREDKESQSYQDKDPNQEPEPCIAKHIYQGFKALIQENHGAPLHTETAGTRQERLTRGAQEEPQPALP